MTRSNLCKYSDAYKPRSGTTTIDGEGDSDAANRADERNKGVIFKNCAACRDIDFVILMHNFTEYGDNYLKISERLWQYYREKPSDQIVINYKCH